MGIESSQLADDVSDDAADCSDNSNPADGHENFCTFPQKGDMHIWRQNEQTEGVQPSRTPQSSSAFKGLTAYSMKRKRSVFT